MSVWLILSLSFFLYGTTLGRPDFIPRLPYGLRPKRLPVVLDRQEVLELFSCVSCRSHRILLTTMYASGMRVGEAMELGVRDIDGHRITILVARGKGNKQRLVPMSPTLLKELRIWWQEHRNPRCLFPGVKPPIEGGPGRILKYLARYVHPVAISNDRLQSIENGQVTFGDKDYAHDHRQRRMTLSANEFLRRLSLHILPRGFVRIRPFGFLANGYRAKKLALIRQIVNVSVPPVAPEASAEQTEAPVPRCPRCGRQALRGIERTAWPRVQRT